MQTQQSDKKPISTPHLVVDARMAEMSGIGVVIRALLARLPQHLPNWRITTISPNAPIYSLAEQWALMRAIPKDTTLFWSPHYNIPLLYRGQLLVTLHDLCHLVWDDYRQSLPKRFYADFMFKQLAKRADKIVCVSDFTRQEALRLTNVTQDKMAVIHNGVDDAWRAIDAKPDVEKPYLLFIGNVKPHKNLWRLLEAYQQTDIAQRLVIVGKRDGFIHGDAQVALLAESMGERIHFTGAVDDPTLHHWMTGATALLMPSLYEGFGLPPLEAMAAGVPVVCSDATSLPEVCGDAALMMNGMDVADMAAKVTRIASDEHLRAELIAKGKTRAQDFSWDKAAKAYAEIITSFT